MPAIPYVPDRGDAIWLECDPQAGREQAGRRPAVVLSPRMYNRKSGLALVCPVTGQAKGYPFEVLLIGTSLQGVVLVDQIRSLDWRSRRAKFITQVPGALMEDVTARLAALLGLHAD